MTNSTESLRDLEFHPKNYSNLEIEDFEKHLKKSKFDIVNYQSNIKEINFEFVSHDGTNFYDFEFTINGIVKRAVVTALQINFKHLNDFTS